MTEIILFLKQYLIRWNIFGGFLFIENRRCDYERHRLKHWVMWKPICHTNIWLVFY